MHVFFDPDGRPFLLGTEMRWELEPNAFLARLSIVSGKTSSPRTWRSYLAMQFGDRTFLVHSSTMNTDFDRQQLAREAKAIVALAFRNGPIENIHAGRPVRLVRDRLVIPGSPMPR